jgi:hypothetical protein
MVRKITDAWEPKPVLYAFLHHASNVKYDSSRQTVPVGQIGASSAEQDVPSSGEPNT